jgi:hypothetical protein
MDFLKTFEAFKDGEKEYYVQWSSWFDTHKYDTEKISEAIKKAGGKYITLKNQWGWSNMPEVVVFVADENILGDIKKSIQEELETQWIIIGDKKQDWKK